MKIVSRKNFTLTEAIRQMKNRDSDSVKAKLRFLDRIRKAPDRNTRGVEGWSREELHQR